MMDQYFKQVEKYIRAQQVSKVFWSENRRDFFFLKIEGAATFLYHLDVSLDSGVEVDLGRARRVWNQDLSKRSLEFERYLDQGLWLYFTQDELNNEFSNLFRLSLDPVSPYFGKAQQLTDVKAFRCPRWDRSFKNLYYQNRYPVEGGVFRTEYYKLDLDTLKSDLLFDDAAWTYKSGWDGFFFNFDESGLICQVDYQNKRELYNFVQIDLKEVKTWVQDHGDFHFPEKQRLLPVSFEDGGLGAYEEESFENGFYFYSESSQFLNFYFYNSKTGRVQTITDQKWINVSFTYLKMRGELKLFIAVPLKESDETELIRIDLQSRENFVTKKVVRGHFSFSFSMPFMIQNSIDQVPKYLLFDEDFKITKSISKFIGANLVHGSYQVLKYKSFDDLEILAYLTMPKTKLRAVAVTAFYGGENYYHMHDQLLLENGIALFSPAVRGSWGWGKKWEDHLKNDLGGKEILDVIWAAKFIANYLQLPHAKVGVQGGSHGGYATLRALTIPSGFAGVEFDFPFGFGICECGFADLEDFHKTSRIADWLVDLLGEYPKNQKLYRERSPLHYFMNLRTPLFIRHGTTDSRVPLSTMTGFIEKLQASPVKHKILIQENQGHHTNDPEKLKYERALILEFLEEVLGRDPYQDPSSGK